MAELGLGTYAAYLAIMAEEAAEAVGSAAVAGAAAAGVNAVVQNQIRPDAIKPPPKINPIAVPALAKKPKEPGAVPGIKETSLGAGANDERRRILAGIPNPTKTQYAGAEMPLVRKKKLLGEGISGSATTGA